MTTTTITCDDCTRDACVHVDDMHFCVLCARDFTNDETITLNERAIVRNALYVQYERNDRASIARLIARIDNDTQKRVRSYIFQHYDRNSYRDAFDYMCDIRAHDARRVTRSHFSRIVVRDYDDATLIVLIDHFIDAYTHTHTR